MTARQAAISEIATHRVAKTQDYLKDAGADIYGSYVFDEGAQRQYLAKPIFHKLRRTSDGAQRGQHRLQQRQCNGGPDAAQERPPRQRFVRDKAHSVLAPQSWAEAVVAAADGARRVTGSPGLLFI